MSASTFNEPNDEQIYVNKLLCTETSGSTSGASFSAKGGTFTVNSENLASDVTTQVLSVDSSGKLEADSAEVSTITVADEIHFTNRIRGYPVLDSGGGLVSNASL